MTEEQRIRAKRHTYREWRHANRMPTGDDAEALWKERQAGKITTLDVGFDRIAHLHDITVSDLYHLLFMQWRAKQSNFLAELYAPGVIVGTKLQWVWFNALDNMDLVANDLEDNAQILGELALALKEHWSH